jgi:hypothetical protein
MLWNLFRHVEGFTAYYEPFNERRWFDPSARGSRVDATHHVDDYWREYEGFIELGDFYDEAWTRRRLYMDEQSWDPAMAAYVRLLIERAPGRAVLQFNRIDFRLPWFRRTFPEAQFVHLYRHPRDQWCSSLAGFEACPPTATLAGFQENDGFYLATWALDLRERFPFLDVPETSHPYRLFYYLWKLSYVYGVAYADYSVEFERLVSNPAGELGQLFEAIGLEDSDPARLAGLVKPMESRWPRYANDTWFRKHEEACEEVLADFFRAGSGELLVAGVQRTTDRPVDESVGALRK